MTETRTQAPTEGLTMADVDAMHEALDVLGFVRIALADSDPMGNESASNGVDVVFGDALDSLARIAQKVDAIWKDGREGAAA